MNSSQETKGTRTGVRKAKSPSAASLPKALSHNLNGQRLGRKGRDTRERIISATQALLAKAEPVPVTLSAVAREASLGMTSLYLYFTDLTELFLAVLEPVMATAEDAYIGAMRARWPDDSLNAHCYEFVSAYYAFWQKHSRILHLRNSMADQHDRRMIVHRISSAQQVINLLITQMDHDVAANDTSAQDMATVLLTGIERVVTVATDADVRSYMELDQRVIMPARLRSVARLLELGIREFR